MGRTDGRGRARRRVGRTGGDGVLEGRGLGSGGMVGRGGPMLGALVGRPEHQEAVVLGGARLAVAKSVSAERSVAVKARWVSLRPQLSKQVPRRW